MPDRDPTRPVNPWPPAARQAVGAASGHPRSFARASAFAADQRLSALEWSALRAHRPVVLRRDLTPYR